MNLRLGERLRIRAMIYVAGERIPYFWPMRGFIHHNPLHGFEHLPFTQGVAEGEALFHARGYLTRAQYQQARANGRIDDDALAHRISAFAADRPDVGGVDLAHWLYTLATQMPAPLTLGGVPSADDLTAVLAGQPLGAVADGAEDAAMRASLFDGRTVYEAVDALFGTGIAEELDELTIKSCLDFFDEGQSSWTMPDRELGFFRAWREVARRNARFYLRRLRIGRVLGESEAPEEVIAHAMRTLGVPEEAWQAYFARELARLHGWAGFIAWRASARTYYWATQYPGDLVDYLAVRLTLAVALLSERAGHRRIPVSMPELVRVAAERPEETGLRLAWHAREVAPALAHLADDALAQGNTARIGDVYLRHCRIRRQTMGDRLVDGVRELARTAGEADALARLDAAGVARLVDAVAAFERAEGAIWLQAAEARAIGQLLAMATPGADGGQSKRPFVQALFCIDTRSERIRRHLERAGDYQTFGIAGFFGVPVSFMELGKGSETHLAPVLLRPKNLVPELSLVGALDEPAFTMLGKALHDLKESVFSPFVTVEAVGMLFGVDMVGKTVAPRSYLEWRNRLDGRKAPTRLLIDKFSREQADSIVRAVQRAVIVKAVRHEFGLKREDVTDFAIRELRELALGNADSAPTFSALAGADAARLDAFVARLRTVYRIDRAFAGEQMERLGRIGFTLDEQVAYVRQALRAIGLTKTFSRFVLLVGHGSRSQNNPYESALDCGACGGNHGLVSARVLAQMANHPGVRRGLREKGIEIPGDTWFVPALHDTTTDEIKLVDVDLMPSSHLVYLDRLRQGLGAAARLCAAERIPTLVPAAAPMTPEKAALAARRNALDWSQVRPEWGLARNAWFVIARRDTTRGGAFEGRAFLHSYDYRVDPKRRLLENILTGPLVVGQWINMEHYFSTVDNARFGSGSKVYHNVAGRFGVMSGNLSDLRTGLPAQTVLKDGEPYHEPMRLITAIEAPFEHAKRAIEAVVAVKRLVINGWIRMLVLDPETDKTYLYEDGAWRTVALAGVVDSLPAQEAITP